ncbi:uncharacterized protein LOC113290788 [Papaver somniferum]|uniref:uncharacterized protein LOC113290788 n=1 Tax=Papaver somniferum TaxID=3469 RepID=UPI000E6FD967|nr:uncharacterized protein LOC113290788 [Papaver somniferum]
MHENFKKGDPFCALCNGDIPETSHHIFKDCRFTKAIWFGLKIQLPSSNNNMMNWVKSWFNSPLNEWKDLFRIICWEIWNHRNSVAFQNVKVNPIECIRSIKKDFNDRELALGKTTLKNNVLIKKKIIGSKDFAEFKDNVFYVDAAFEESDGSTTSSKVAEALAVKKAADWARELNKKNVKIRSDCRDVVNFLNRRNVNCDWRTKKILNDVLSLLGSNFGRY